MNVIRQWTVLMGLLGGLFISQGVYAQVYTWVDKDGITHYSNQPYEFDKHAEPVSIRAANHMAAVKIDAKASKTKKAKPLTKNSNANKQARDALYAKCDRWRGELASLKRGMKKGYSLRKAKALKQEKLDLRDRLWRECR